MDVAEALLYQRKTKNIEMMTFLFENKAKFILALLFRKEISLIFLCYK